MVAFAGAAALGRRFPRAAPILYGLAAGCGLTRVFAQAHFLSDEVAAGFGGTVTGRWVAGRVLQRAARGESAAIFPPCRSRCVWCCSALWRGRAIEP
jgi:hypothetical protein